MSSKYAVEEREQQIAALRELKKLRKRERQGLLPKSLLDSAHDGASFSAEEVRNLSEQEYQNPVISFYMRLNGLKTAPREKAPVRFFRSLKTQAVEHRKDFLDTLTRPQRNLLDYDLKEIELFLENYFVPEEIHSVIIFKSAEQLNRVIALPVGVTDNLVIDPDPYVLPLEMVLEEFERVLLIEVTKDTSHLTIFQLGFCQEADKIKSFVPTDRVDASITGHAQRHRLTHLQWHLKATAQRAYHVFNERACRVLVVMAEERVCHMFESFLHESLRQRIIQRVYGSPATDARQRSELVENALRDHKAAHEVYSVDEVREYKPSEDVVSGLPSVIKACNLFLMRKLVLNQSLHEKGLVCKQHHYLALEPGECPFCNSPLLPVENVADEMIEIARLHGVEITLIEYREDLMARYQGIAALLYAPLREA